MGSFPKGRLWQPVLRKHGPLTIETLLPRLTMLASFEPGRSEAVVQCETNEAAIRQKEFNCDISSQVHPCQQLMMQSLAARRFWSSLSLAKMRLRWAQQIKWHSNVQCKNDIQMCKRAFPRTGPWLPEEAFFLAFIPNFHEYEFQAFRWGVLMCAWLQKRQKLNSIVSTSAHMQTTPLAFPCCIPPRHVRFWGVVTSVSVWTSCLSSWSSSF